MRRLRVCVVGAGSIGCLFGSRLARSGLAQVTLVGRPSPHSDRGAADDGASSGSGRAVRECEVRVRELSGAETVARALGPARGLRAVDFQAGVHPFEVVLVTVKHNDTAQVGEALRHAAERRLLDAATTIISVQNGLGNVELLQGEGAAALRGSVVQGLTYQGASVLGPLYVSHNGPGRTFIEAERCQGAEEQGQGSRERRRKNVELFLQALGSDGAGGGDDNQRCELIDDAEAMLLTKLLANVVINPLTALLDRTNGAVAEPSQAALVDAAAREFEAFAATRGYSCAAGDKQLLLGDCASAGDYVRAVATATAANTSSMLADVRAGRATEIEAMNGAVVREARSKGLELPVLDSLYQRVLDLSSTTMTSS